MEENGDVKEQYEIVNDESAWVVFKERYISLKLEISLELSTPGKQGDLGFHVHLANPSKLPLIFNVGKKNDSEDSYKLANLLMVGALLEVYLPLLYSDYLRSSTLQKCRHMFWLDAQ